MPRLLKALLAAVAIIITAACTRPAPVALDSDTAIQIPQQATVLTLLGLNFDTYNYMPYQLRGMFRKSPYVLRKVEYPASADRDSISTGVVNLNTALRATAGPKIVLAHSQGAQVASRWMRKYATDPTAPQDVTFILTGNPLRNPTGKIVGGWEIGGTRGVATSLTTPWPIIDVARQQDYWAIWTGTTNRSGAHTHYDVVDLFSSQNVVTHTGNTTFVVAP